MEYCSIPDLAKKFWTTDRTIYEYLKKFRTEILTKEENWSKLIHLDDFFRRTSKRLQNFYRASQWRSENQMVSNFWSTEVQHEELQKNFNTPPQQTKNFRSSSEAGDENPFLERFRAIEVKYEELQSTVKAITATNQQLEKARDNFENQAKEYGILYKDELAEKKQREERFLTLQDTHLSTRIRLERIINILIVFLLLVLVTARLLSSLGIAEIKPLG